MGSRKALAGALSTLACTVVVLLSATTVAAGGAATAAIQGRSPLATPSARLAATPAGANVRFSVGLKMVDRAGALELEREVTEPASAQYRDYLTPAQWERRFSPPRSAVTAVSEWLRSQGITVAGVSADRMTVQAEGSAAAVGKAFGVTLGEYRQGSTELRLASGSLEVPSSVAPLVSGVVGVNQVPATHPSLTGAEPPAGELGARPRRGARPAIANDGSRLAPPPGFKNAPPCSAYYGQKAVTGQPAFGGGFPRPLTWAPCGYVPAQLQSAYNLAGPIAAGIDGKGVTVAIIDAYASPTLFEDAKKYDENNQKEAVLSSEQFKELQSTSYTEEALCDASSWSEEQTLDVESVHATAPGANILYVGAENCLDTGLFGAVQKVVDEHLASVVTDSWGDDGGDLLDPTGEREAFDNVLIMADDTGVGVQFSAGDEGSNFVDLGMNVADYPAESPYVTSVGGTSLQVGKEGARLGETGWSTSKSYLCTGLLEEAALPGCGRFGHNTWDPGAPGAYDYGGGGGSSFNFPEPWYQEGTVPASLAARNAKITGVANRVEPDISMDADPSTGMKIGETQEFSTGVAYGEYRLGGTSLASPLLAGVMADADQEAGASLGFANPLLYKLAYLSTSPYLAPGAINDVVAGGKQAVERNDYLVPEAEAYPYTTARVLGYEGLEEYCSGTEECETQNVILHAAPRFDSMTGVGSPGPEFLYFASTIKPSTP